MLLPPALCGLRSFLQLCPLRSSRRLARTPALAGLRSPSNSRGFSCSSLLTTPATSPVKFTRQLVDAHRTRNRMQATLVDRADVYIFSLARETKWIMPLVLLTLSPLELTRGPHAFYHVFFIVVSTAKPPF